MIQFLTITQNLDSTWVFTWADTGASSYRVVLNGELLATTSQLTYTFTRFGYPSSPPLVEVVPSGELAQSELYPATFPIQWYWLGVSYYSVKQLIGGVWTEVGQVLDDGSWVFTFQPRGLLVDETDYNFQVTAINSVNLESLPRQYDISVVTSPVPPTVTIEYDQGAHAIKVS